MKKISAKLIRENMDTKITKYFRKLYPHFQFEHRFLRQPLYPKIVLYSGLPSVNRFIEQIFPSFRLINPRPSNERDQDFTMRVACDTLQSLNEEQQQKSMSTGVIINGFPFNTSQALLLDRSVNGVNLAIHVKSVEKNAQNFASLLQYYQERGTLLQVDYNDNLTPQEVQKIQTKISLNMKYSD